MASNRSRMQQQTHLRVGLYHVPANTLRSFLPLQRGHVCVLCSLHKSQRTVITRLPSNTRCKRPLNLKLSPQYLVQCRHLVTTACACSVLSGKNHATLTTRSLLKCVTNITVQICEACNLEKSNYDVLTAHKASVNSQVNIWQKSAFAPCGRRRTGFKRSGLFSKIYFGWNFLILQVSTRLCY